MKKIYLLLGGIVLAGAMNAQKSATISEQKENLTAKEGTTKVVNAAAIEKGTKASYLSEDFESGTFPPTGWTISSGSNSTITVPAEQAWHEETTKGNPGSCVSVLYNNSADVHDEWLISPVVNLTSSSPNVRLTFQFNTSQYWHVTPNDNADIWVKVSTDGGTTWSDTVFVEDDTALLANALLDINWEQYTWTTARVNISQYAGNASVMFAWHYEGQDGAQYNLDNISVTDIEQNDLVITHDYFGSADLTYFGIPTTQIQPIDFSVNVANLGLADQTNSILTVDVDGGAQTLTSATATIVAGASDSLFTSTQYTPAAAVATHNITMTVSSDFTDAIPADNTVTKIIDITDFLYARDEGNYASQGGGDDGNGNFGFEAGSYFDIVNNQDVWGVDVVIGTNTPDGTLIYGKIYTYDATNSAWVEVAACDEYTVSAADASSNATITLPVLNPTTLTAGTTYFAAVGTYSEFYYGRSGYSETGTSLIYYPNMQGGAAASGNYYTNDTPMIRLNFDMSLGVKENAANGLSLEQNMPNPFGNTTTINYSVSNSSEVTLNIVDMTGKVVMNINEGIKTPGSYSININAGELAEGMYFYTLSNGTASLTKNMTITK